MSLNLVITQSWTQMATSGEEKHNSIHFTAMIYTHTCVKMTRCSLACPEIYESGFNMQMLKVMYPLPSKPQIIDCKSLQIKCNSPATRLLLQKQKSFGSLVWR